MISVQRV